jgi:hypothetical protein
MSDKSPIEWTDATWNPVRGCTKISAGCKHCYAETFAERFRGVPGHPYQQGFEPRTVPDKLGEPLRWKRPRKIFVNSMSDLFHPQVPDEFIVSVAKVMMEANWHTYQVLTKRSERMSALLNTKLEFAALLSPCDQRPAPRLKFFPRTLTLTRHAKPYQGPSIRTRERKLSWCSVCVSAPLRSSTWPSASPASPPESSSSSDSSLLTGSMR